MKKLVKESIELSKEEILERSLIRLYNDHLDDLTYSGDFEEVDEKILEFADEWNLSLDDLKEFIFSLGEIPNELKIIAELIEEIEM